MIRIINVEAPSSEGPGIVLDIYAEQCVFRAEMRDPEETIIFAATSGNLDGEGSVLESVETHFVGLGDHTTGKLLVERARAEMKFSGVNARPVVPGWKLA